MAKKDFSKAEKNSWKRGFFTGLFKRKKKTTSKKQSSSAKKKEYSFLAFNENCDIFNVHAEGTSRKNALSNAEKYLKRDPEIPSWGVRITEQEADNSYYRHVTVKSNGEIKDNWEPRYRSRDEQIRQKYPDLSKPVK